MNSERGWQSSNPFSRSSRSLGSEATGSTVADCVTFRLDGAEALQGEAPNLRVHVENRCGAPAAVVTAPLEVVVLDHSNHLATWPMSHAVYAVLYVQPKVSEEPRLNYLSDGGLKVLRLPRYFRVLAGASAEIPVIGEHEALRQLPVGTYWLVLQTPVILASDADPMNAPFDLQQSVERHNSLSGEDAEAPIVAMPSRAVRMGAATTLTVLPARVPASS